MYSTAYGSKIINYHSSTEEIKFKNEYFDIIYCNLSLNHIHNIEKFIKEIHRVLKPNGWLIVREYINHDVFDAMLIEIKQIANIIVNNQDIKKINNRMPLRFPNIDGWNHWLNIFRPYSAEVEISNKNNNNLNLISWLIYTKISKSGGTDEKKYYITTVGKNNKFVQEIFIWKMFFRDAYKIIDIAEYKKSIDSVMARFVLKKSDDFPEKAKMFEKIKKKPVSYEAIFNNLLVAYMFDSIKFPDFNETTALAEKLISKIGIKTFNNLRDFYNSLFKKYPIISISKNKTKCVDSCTLFHFKNRIGYNTTDIEKFNATYFVEFITSMQPGNQWTLVSDENMKKLLKEGLLIECFGSSFNTRAPYFGSLNAVDEPFGRIGDAFEILEKIANNEPLYWRNKMINNGGKLFISINPPSSGYVVWKAFEAILKVLENRKSKIKILFEIPLCQVLNEYKALDKYVIEKKILDEAWDFNGNFKSLKDKEWVEYMLEN